MIQYLRTVLVQLLFIACCTMAGTAQGQVTANFTADHTAGCAPLIVHFTNTSTGATSYTWSLGNSNTSLQTNASASYTTPGIYTVVLTAINGSQSSTKTLTITVYGPPLVSFSAPLTVCVGTPFSFTNTTTAGVPGPVTYNWSFGDGGTSTAVSPTYTYSTPGFYTVSLQATNSQGCDSLLIKTSYIHVLPAPVAQFTVNNAQFCKAPATALFTDQSTGTTPFTYTWTFGNGNSSFSQNPTNIYQSTGTYTVTLVTTDANGCKDTDVQAAYIKVGGPTASFTPPTGCAGAPVSFQSSSTPAGVQAHWSFGDGGIANGTPTTHTYSSAGIYSVRLIVDDGNCKDTLTLPVTISPNPVASFTFTLPSCNLPTTVQFTSTAPAGGSYAWSFSDGGSSAAANPTHTYNAFAIDSATLTVTNANGCSATVTQAVNVNDIYAVGIAQPLSSGCIPLTVNFSSYDSTNTPSPSASVPYPITSTVWNFGDGSPLSNNANPQHTYNTPGVFAAYVIITTSNGCTKVDTVQIRTAPIPQVSITAQPTRLCTDQNVIFHATPINGALYTWYFKDGSSPVSQYNDSFDIHKYVNPGLDTPFLIVSLNGCNDTVTNFHIYLQVDSPKSLFLSNYFCDTLTKVAFTNLSLGANTSAWSFGDGFTSAATSPTHNYPGLGSYNVQLITFNTASGCHDTLNRPVTLLKLQPSFTAADTAICKRSFDTFYAAVSGGGATRYDWYVDNNPFPNLSSTFTDSFGVQGRHSVALVVTDAHNCTDTFRRNNYVLVAQPKDSFVVAPLQGCLPLTVQFNDYSYDVPGAHIVSRSWFYSDGHADLNGTPAPTHTYTTRGSFGPEEVVIDNLGCTDTLYSPAGINVYKPTAAFTAATTFPCRYIPVQFNNTSTNAATSAWTFGDNTTSNLNAPTHTYTQNGTYSVSLIVTDTHGCMDTAVRNAYLNLSSPTAAFTLGDSVSICAPLIEHFINTSVNAVSYAWDFGNTGTSVLTNPTQPYTSAGSYTPRLIATDAHGCKDTTTRTLKIYGYAGEFTITPITGCSPLTVNFTANITNVPHITWDFSDGNVSATTSSVTATHTYTAPGVYVPKLIISDSTGCAASSIGDSIKVDGIIGGFTTIPYPVCIYDTVKFSDTSKSLFTPIVSRNWTFNSTTNTSAVSPAYFFNNANDLTVRLIDVNGNGCRDTVTGSVKVHPLPIINASSDTVICLHDSATLTATGGISYVWSPATTLSCTACAITHAMPLTAAMYLVKGTDGFGCTNIDSTKVKLKSKTTDWPGTGGEICYGQSLTLTDSGAQTYNWYPTAGLNNSTIANPVASPSSSTNYMVVAHQGSCVPDTSWVSVIVHPKPTIKATAGNATIIAGSATDVLATGTNILTFLWEPATLLDCDSCSRAIAKLTQTTTFTAIGTTKYGCQDSDKVTVNVICDKSQVFIPNTFTPNGDGQNDVFYPRGVGLKTINYFRIFNRWGELLFERTGIQLNDESSAWDGTIKGALPKPDVYVYVLDGVCDNGSPISWKGDVTLVR